MTLEEFIEKANRIVNVEKDPIRYRNKKLLFIHLSIKDDPLGLAFISFNASGIFDSINCRWAYARDLSAGKVFEILKLIKLLADTPVEQRFSKKEFTVQVIKNDPTSYVNLEIETNNYFFDNNKITNGIKVSFTEEELDKMKKDDNFAIDWSKAVIKEIKKNND